MRPRVIDREALHRLLWLRANRHGQITFKQSDLCIEVGVSNAHFCRVMREMMEDGRLTQNSPNGHVYMIVDPELWMVERIKIMAEGAW